MVNLVLVTRALPRLRRLLGAKSSGTARAAVILTGDELVDGSVRDNNYWWVAQYLTALGFEMVPPTFVRDRPREVKGALRRLSRRSRRIRLIIVVGGMGPTGDDVSREVIAAFTGRALAEEPRLSKRIEGLAAGILRPARRAWLRTALDQARIPAGAVVVTPEGRATAAPFVVPASRRGTIIVGIPGPPGEVRAAFPGVLYTAPMQDLLAGIEAPARRELRLVAGGALDETMLSRIVEEELEALGADTLNVGTCFESDGAELSVVTTFPRESAEAYLAFEARLVERLGSHIVSVDGESVLAIFEMLIDERTVGVVDAANSGLVGPLMQACGVDHPQIGFDPNRQGGARTLQLLGISPGDAQDARTLAAAARQHWQTDIGIGIAPARNGEALHIAVLDAEGTVLEQTIDPPAPDPEASAQELDKPSARVMYLLTRLLGQRIFDR